MQPSPEPTQLPVHTGNAAPIPDTNSGSVNSDEAVDTSISPTPKRKRGEKRYLESGASGLTCGRKRKPTCHQIASLPSWGDWPHRPVGGASTVGAGSAETARSIVLESSVTMCASRGITSSVVGGAKGAAASKANKADDESCRSPEVRASNRARLALCTALALHVLAGAREHLVDLLSGEI